MIYLICGSLDVGIFKNFFLVTYIIIILLWLPAAQVHYAVCVVNCLYAVLAACYLAVDILPLFSGTLLKAVSIDTLNVA